MPEVTHEPPNETHLEVGPHCPVCGCWMFAEREGNVIRYHCYGCGRDTMERAEESKDGR